MLLEVQILLAEGKGEVGGGEGVRMWLMDCLSVALLCAALAHAGCTGQSRGTEGGRRRLSRVQHGACSYTFVLPELEGGCRGSAETHSTNFLQRDAPQPEQEWPSQALQRLETRSDNNTQWLRKVRAPFHPLILLIVCVYLCACVQPTSCLGWAPCHVGTANNIHLWHQWENQWRCTCPSGYLCPLSQNITSCLHPPSSAPIVHPDIVALCPKRSLSTCPSYSKIPTYFQIPPWTRTSCSLCGLATLLQSQPSIIAGRASSLVQALELPPHLSLVLQLAGPRTLEFPPYISPSPPP